MNKRLIIYLLISLKGFSQNPNLNWDKISSDIFTSLVNADTNLILKYTPGIEVSKRFREVVCDTNIERKKYINKKLQSIVDRDRERNVYHALSFNKRTKKESGVDLKEIKKITYDLKYYKINEYKDCFNNAYDLIIRFSYLNTPYNITIRKLAEVDDHVYILKTILWDVKISDKVQK